MDATSLLAAAQSVLAPRITEDDIKKMAEANGAKTPQELAFVLSIFDNESTGGKNPNAYGSRVVSNGSTISGPMQVMTKANKPGASTFDMFAAPGKNDPSNHYHTSEAGVRYALEAWKQSKGDPALAFKKYQAGLGFDGKTTRSDGLSTTDEYATKGLQAMGRRVGLPVPGEPTSGFADVQKSLSLAVEQARAQATTNGKVLDTFGMNVEGANAMLAQVSGQMAGAAQRMEHARAARSFGPEAGIGDRFLALLRTDASVAQEKEALSEFSIAAKMAGDLQALAKNQIALQASTVPADAKILEAQGKLAIQDEKNQIAQQRQQLAQDMAMQRAAQAETAAIISKQKADAETLKAQTIAERLQAQLSGALPAPGAGKAAAGISSEDVVAVGKTVGLDLPPGTTLKNAETLLKGFPAEWARLRQALIKSGTEKEGEIPLAGTMIDSVRADVNLENTTMAELVLKQKGRALWEGNFSSPETLSRLTGSQVRPQDAATKLAEAQKDKNMSAALKSYAEETTGAVLFALAKGKFDIKNPSKVVNSTQNPYVPVGDLAKSYLTQLAKADPFFKELEPALSPIVSKTQRPNDLYLGIANAIQGFEKGKDSKFSNPALVAEKSSYVLSHFRQLHIAESNFVKHKMPVPAGTFVLSPTGTLGSLNLENPAHMRVWLSVQNAYKPNAILLGIPMTALGELGKKAIMDWRTR
jgi:hypothetical protein